MRYGIMGGGFGMYGYLPAVAAMDSAVVVTLEKYRETIRQRSELSHFEARIDFVDDPATLFARCETLIIAQRPADQERLVEHLLSINWRGTLLLEKPLARTPARATSMLQRLEVADLRFAVGFSLLETDWAREVNQTFCTAQPSSLSFDWRFMAHHYRCDLTNWKRQVSEGGGALRFFAIHLVAILSKLTEWEPRSCSPRSRPDEDASFECNLSSARGQASIHCDSAWQGEPVFSVRIKQGERVLLDRRLPEPFAGHRTDHGVPAAGEDNRVAHIGHILRRLKAGQIAPPHGYQAHLRLWDRMEQLRVESADYILPR